MVEELKNSEPTKNIPGPQTPEQIRSQMFDDKQKLQEESGPESELWDAALPTAVGENQGRATLNGVALPPAVGGGTDGQTDNVYFAGRPAVDSKSIVDGQNENVVGGDLSQTWVRGKILGDREAGDNMNSSSTGVRRRGRVSGQDAGSRDSDASNVSSMDSAHGRNDVNTTRSATNDILVQGVVQTGHEIPGSRNSQDPGVLTAGVQRDFSERDAGEAHTQGDNNKRMPAARRSESDKRMALRSRQRADDNVHQESDIMRAEAPADIRRTDISHNEAGLGSSVRRSGVHSISANLVLHELKVASPDAYRGQAVLDVFYNVASPTQTSGHARQEEPSAKRGNQTPGGHARHDAFASPSTSVIPEVPRQRGAESAARETPTHTQAVRAKTNSGGTPSAVESGIRNSDSEHSLHVAPADDKSGGGAARGALDAADNRVVEDLDNLFESLNSLIQKSKSRTPFTSATMDRHRQHTPPAHTNARTLLFLKDIFPPPADDQGSSGIV